MVFRLVCFFFFFNDTAPTEIYTLPLHDALPISPRQRHAPPARERLLRRLDGPVRSEEHTSELQSRVDISYAVFCLKKKRKYPCTAMYWTDESALRCVSQVTRP